MEYSNLTSITHGSIELAPGAPKAFLEMVMPNTKVNHAEGAYGRLMYQEIEVSPFSIHYNVYDIENRFLLHVEKKTPALMLYVILKNDMHFQLRNFGEMHLKEGQFNIAYLPDLDCTAFFEDQGEYQNFKIYFPVELLQEYAATFPYLNEFLQQATGPDPVFLLQEPGWISSKISYVINEFLECTYNEQVRRQYFEILIKELLLLLLLQKHRNGNDYNTYMQHLYEARSIILKNPGKHFTIGEIAQQVGLNEARLKSGFKQVFGTGLFQYMLEAKMQKAFQWVVDTDKPVKEIARLTGYTSLQNFLTAFKKYFKTTPGALRKKQ